jgi:hypothetical protein
MAEESEKTGSHGKGELLTPWPVNRRGKFARSPSKTSVWRSWLLP